MKKSVGQRGEDDAVKYLKNRGFKILDRNYKNKLGRQLGEIDVIAQKGNCIHFVEVKARKGAKADLFSAESNINQGKLKKVSRISEVYIKEKDLWQFDCQFDAFLVVFGDDFKLKDSKYIENIHF